MSRNWNFLQKLGMVLVLVSSFLLLATELLAAYNRTAAQKLADEMGSYCLERTEGDPENYSDPVMPVLQLREQDFTALIEIPSYGVSLPVGAVWNAVTASRYPCRFWGSVYDNSMIIGGSSRKGQFDFCGKVDLGENIRIVDMTGSEFSYEVVGIDRRKHADMDAFLEKQSDLILFTQDSASNEYIIVRCMFA